MEMDAVESVRGSVDWRQFPLELEQRKVEQRLQARGGSTRDSTLGLVGASSPMRLSRTQQELFQKVKSYSSFAMSKHNGPKDISVIAWMTSHFTTLLRSLLNLTVE